jgi:aldose 1-epimerase
MSRPFGRTAGGEDVDLFTLGSEQGLQAEILTLGGILRSLTFPVRGKRIQLVLNFPDLAGYLKDTSYIGQLVGRYGNRIGGAAFELDGKRYELSRNNGPNTLHGGETGFGKYVWKVLDSGRIDVLGKPRDHVTLGHLSPTGINGFPGNLDVSANISVHGNVLSLVYEATTDAPTPVNLTWHPYFNLSGDPGRPIDEQQLMIHAGHYLPINDVRVPTGEIASVTGTPFDFRKPKSVALPPASSHPQIALAGGYDHCWALDPNPAKKAALVFATLHSPASGVRMGITTNLPGLQVYGAYHLKRVYPGWHAICLEPENFPDAPNHANFPSSILRPGENLRAQMSFHFGA